jgi:hypothetical protein
LPIKNDLHEASKQYDLLTDFIKQNLRAISGSDPVRTQAKLAEILAQSFDKEYFGYDIDASSQYASVKSKIADSVRFLMDGAGAPFSSSFRDACQNSLTTSLRKNIEVAYAYRN